MPTNTSLASAAATELGYSREKLQLIKDTIAKGATDDELALFLYAAQRTGLDPFSGQIRCIKRWDSALGREVATPQTGIDGYRLIAERTGDYTPGKAPTFEYDQSGELFSATAYVKKFKHGEWHEVAATAHYAEYVQTKKNGEVNAMWKKGKHFMLAKCAESLALRRAFPAELSGVYTTEELGGDDHAALPQPQQAPMITDVTPQAEQNPPKTRQQALTRQQKFIGRVRDLMAEYYDVTGEPSPDLAVDLKALSEDELIALGKRQKELIKEWEDQPAEFVPNETPGASYEPDTAIVG